MVVCLALWFGVGCLNSRPYILIGNDSAAGGISFGEGALQKMTAVFFNFWTSL